MIKLKNIIVIPLLGLGLLSSCQCAHFTDDEVDSDTPGDFTDLDINNDQDQKETPKEEEKPTPVGPKKEESAPDAYGSITFDRYEDIIHVLVPSSDEVYNSLTSYHSDNLNQDFSVSLKKHVFAVADPISATLTYESTDTSIATVDEEGVVTGLKPNAECDIKVKSSTGIVKYIPVKTYSEDNYFKFAISNITYYKEEPKQIGDVVLEDFIVPVFTQISDMSITGCVDKDIEELLLPPKKTGTNEIVRGVKTSVFSTTRKLKKIIVPNGYYNLGSYNFLGAIQLNEIHIPESLFDAGFMKGNFISSKNSLENITMDTSNIYYSSEKYSYAENSGYIFYIYPDYNPYDQRKFTHFVYAYGDVDGTKLFDTEKYPDTISICSNSLSGLDSLVDLVIPNTEELKGLSISLEDGADHFTAAIANCKNLRSVTISNPDFYINAMAEFSNCPNLETFNIDPACKFFTTKDDSGYETNSLIYKPFNSLQDIFVNESKRREDEAFYDSELNGKKIKETPKAYVFRGTKNSTFRDNATYFNGISTKLGFNSGSFVGVNYNGILKLPNNATSIGWGAFYCFNADGVFLPKNTYFTDSKVGKYGAMRTHSNGHKITYYGKMISDKYFEPTYIDDNIVQIPGLGTDIEKTNPCCFWCDSSFKVYVEDLANHPYKEQLSLCAETDPKNVFNYTVQQKTASQI